MEKFLNGMKTELDEEISFTENGATGFTTSGKELLDMNFKLSSYRNKNAKEIEKDFAKTYYADPKLAMKFLFFIRDREKGNGERRTFRVCYKWLANNHEEYARAVMPLVAYYGRFDDLFVLFDTPLESYMTEYVRTMLADDYNNYLQKKTISLLAKWMPSCSTSSKKTRMMAKRFVRAFNTSERDYRKMLSTLREYSNILETKISSNRWCEIPYNSVPSKANILYKYAFLRHDGERRRTYLESLRNGDANVKINSSVNFPHDIVHAYSERYGWQLLTKSSDIALEEIWKALPDYVNGNASTICVTDSSGSMVNRVGNTELTAMECSYALGIYFAERLSGVFKDKLITFSHRPQLVDMSKCETLRDKLNLCYKMSEVADTNIEKTFMLILNTAINNKLNQDEIPQNVLILSDMEFNEGVEDRGKKTLFRTIQAKFEENGYKMPRVIYWNLCSRTGALPVNTHETFPVTLVSGFSPAIMDMVLSNETDPYECLLKKLNSDRYDLVQDAIDGVSR